MKKEHFKHVLELYAKRSGYKLSPYADKILTRCLEHCEGACPCDTSRGLCPCAEHEREIAEMGHCHCNLFLKGDEG